MGKHDELLAKLEAYVKLPDDKSPEEKLEAGLSSLKALEKAIKLVRSARAFSDLVNLFSNQLNYLAQLEAEVNAALGNNSEAKSQKKSSTSSETTLAIPEASSSVPAPSYPSSTKKD